MTTDTAAVRAPATRGDTRDEVAPRAPRRIRWRRYILPVIFWALILYTLVPIIVMMVYSFNNAPTSRITFAWNGFTLNWYRNLTQVPDLTNSFLVSLEIALLSTIISVLIATPLAMALARHRYAGRTGLNITIFADIAAPSVVVGAALLSFYIQVKIPQGFGGILIAHVAFNVAYAVVVIRARLVGMGQVLEEAAQDLYASPFSTFMRVTLPLIMPGIFAAALLAFAMSIDDYVITSFVAGATVTFPLYVYGAVKVGLPPQVLCFGTVIFMVGLMIAVTNVVLSRRRRAVSA